MIEKLANWSKNIMAVSALVTFLFGVVTTVFIFTVTVVMDRNGDVVFNYLADNLGITEMQIELKDLSGAGGVFQTEPLSNYAIKPIYRDKPVTINSTIRRTPLGMGCMIKDATTAKAIFRDERNIPMVGTVLSKFQNVGSSYQDISTTMQPPMDPRNPTKSLLEDGRIRVYIQAFYTCAGGLEISDFTETTVYEQLPPLGE